MKILFLARHKLPHVGGVERHIERITKSLRKRRHKIIIVSKENIKYPHVKFLGLFYIWFWLFKNRGLIEQSNIIHCHDVFIWYLPFRFIYPSKPVYTTFHGWEGIYPIPLKNILIKRLSAYLSWGNICVGKYIEKYYGIRADIITYGGIEKTGNLRIEKIKNLIVYVGRLEKDTGVPQFLKWLKGNKKHKIDFCGDGSLRKECEKYGVVHGFVDPKPFLARAEHCVPGGYLSYIEAKSYECKIKVFWNNPLKKDYWREIQKVSKFPTWDKIANEYISLYNRF